jgi:hypothetical protein
MIITITIIIIIIIIIIVNIIISLLPTACLVLTVRELLL